MRSSIESLSANYLRRFIKNYLTRHSQCGTIPIMKRYKMKQCKLCGIAFTPNSGSQVYCSKLCSRQANINRATKRNKRLPQQFAIVMRKGHYRRKYNTTIADYDFLMAIQANRCAMCGKTEQDINKHLDIDHDHFTGRARGLLCSGCNRIVGRAERLCPLSQKTLIKVEKYLAGRVKLTYN